MSRNWSLALAVAFALGFALKAYLDADQATQSSADSATLDPQEIVLFGERGTPMTLFDPSDSRIRVIYFGFTRCPDVCPTSLAMLAGALNQLPDETKLHYRPIFISLDPERDDATTAAKYAHYFHPSIEGLSAPLDITTPLAHRYGVIFRKTELENSQLEYTLDHSSYFYFVDSSGTLLTKVPHTLNPGPIVEAFHRLQAQPNPHHDLKDGS